MNVSDTLTFMDECVMEGCDRPVYARGACTACYQRLRYQGRLDELVLVIPEKTCAHCGVTFHPRSLRLDSMYCTRKCIDAARTARRRAEAKDHVEWIECEQCGKELVKKRSDARFCSDLCGQTWNNKRRADEKRAEREAAQAPCLGCGGRLGPRRSLFCSMACAKKSRSPIIHGISVADYEAMLERQGNACAICQAPEWGVKGPQIDHDHQTDEVRGVLCTNHNIGLGYFSDDPQLLRAAAEYLERHAAAYLERHAAATP